MVFAFHRSAVATILLGAFVSHCFAQPCTNPVTACDPNKDYFPDKISLEHATTAKLTYANTFVDVEVTDTNGVKHLHRLVRCGCTAQKPTEETQLINVPPAQVFVNDGPTLAFLTRSLGQTDKIVAVGNPGIIYSSSIRKRFGLNETTSNAQLNNRTDVDVAFINLDSVSRHKTSASNIPFFANGESDEPMPLGRSEWIKIIGLMFDSVEVAETEFADIVKLYNRMKALANSATRRPSVLLNYPFTYQGTTSWGMPSEAQYITQYLRDANVDYLFADDGKNSTNSLQLSEVTENFKWARYMLHSKPYPPSKSAAMEKFFRAADVPGANATNEALRKLAAVRCANVWIQNKRITSETLPSANDFFELGSVRPDLVLQDIVHAVHPNIDVNSDTTFSFKVEDAPDAIKGGACPYNDLLGAAPKGKEYVDFEMEVTGQNRFQVENKLVENIIPQVAKSEYVDSKSIDAFFQKPEKPGTTILKLRLIVDEDNAVRVADDGTKITEDIRVALGDSATVQLKQTIRPGQVIIQTRGRLSGGAIAGIVLGCIALALLVGLVLFFVGSRRGRHAGAQEIRDRFWNEHGVRLLDEIEKDGVQE